MQELTEILQHATAEVTEEYFMLKIDGGSPIYRERVYCYELYHQMRVQWPEDTDLVLNGEVDKAGHQILAELGADHVKPDFLVHRPGHMSRNDTIIEVKSKRLNPKGLKKDLESLSLFRNVVGYERAIYLIYGVGIDVGVLLERIHNVSRDVENLAAIEIWVHTEANTPAFQIGTITP
ncbi:hypothetical protein [Shewanella sp.]|uniref:hypothetical protein n=1 Tax=Shewanella sp. TaxID=50422 RepID=UPI001EC82E7A|nr:hypothetical protein [Shewanella sp.]NRB23486.1 methionyl-tRNA formyltransferase-like protein [Shewanella sp.]